MTAEEFAQACRHAYASAPPDPKENFGKGKRNLNRSTDEEIRRRGYGFIGKWGREDSQRIATFLRSMNCLVVEKPNRSRLELGVVTLWAKKRELGND